MLFIGNETADYDSSKPRQKVIVMFDINSAKKLFVIIYKLLIYIKSKLHAHILNIYCIYQLDHLMSVTSLTAQRCRCLFYVFW